VWIVGALEAEPVNYLEAEPVNYIVSLEAEITDDGPTLTFSERHVNGALGIRRASTA
jgi:hypothetical protein